MIVNFEEETSDLTASEVEICRYVAKKISLNIGKDMAVTHNTMTEAIKRDLGVKVSGARIRKIINCIRINGLAKDASGNTQPVVATNKGYYVSNDQEEIRKYVLSLRQRADAINAVAQSMENILILKRTA